MRWTQLAGRKIIDVADGRCLGDLADVDLLLDEDGRILSLLVRESGRKGWRRKDIPIPWPAITRIGTDVCLLDRRLIPSWSGGEPGPGEPEQADGEGGGRRGDGDVFTGA